MKTHALQSIDYARIQDLSPLPLYLPRRESLTTLTCAHDILLVTILTCLSAFLLCLVCLYMITERDGCKPLLYQLRVSRVVCGPLSWAPPTSPHSCVWPSSRASAHHLSPCPCTGTTVRQLSFFLRWTDATPFSLSNTRSRFIPIYPSTLRVRGTLALLPPPLTPQDYDGGVRTLASID